MGGAQPLAAMMNGGAMLCVEVDRYAACSVGSRRRYCDRMTGNLDKALVWVQGCRG